MSDGDEARLKAARLKAALAQKLAAARLTAKPAAAGQPMPIDAMSLPAGADPATDQKTGVMNELGNEEQITATGTRYTISAQSSQRPQGGYVRAMGRAIANDPLGVAGGVAQGLYDTVSVPANAARGQLPTTGDLIGVATMMPMGVGAGMAARTGEILPPQKMLEDLRSSMGAIAERPGFVGGPTSPVGQGRAALPIGGASGAPASTMPMAAGSAAPAANGLAVVPQSIKPVMTAIEVSKAKPSLDAMRAAKNMAYKAVDDAGEVFDETAMADLSAKVKAALNDGNYVEGVDRQTDAVVAILDRKSTEPLKLGQLDKLRQNFYKRLAAAPNEVGISDAIDAIDEMIASNAGTSELMQAARLANSRYKKTELLDRAFTKAADQTSATGSGGNILNKYRQAVSAIKNNPKLAKWFSAEELKAMGDFIEGTKGQNALRLFGKLSPDGNGLMMALNLFGAGATGGTSLVVTGLAAGAKAIADRAATRGADKLMKTVARGTKEAPRAAPKVGLANPSDIIVSPLGAITAGQVAAQPSYMRHGERE